MSECKVTDIEEVDDRMAHCQTDPNNAPLSISLEPDNEDDSSTKPVSSTNDDSIESPT